MTRLAAPIVLAALVSVPLAQVAGGPAPRAERPAAQVPELVPASGGALPTEPATPDPDFLQFGTVAGQSLRSYDCYGCVARILETLDDFGSKASDGIVRSACLDARLLGSCAVAANDSLAIGWETGATGYDWSTLILEAAGGDWGTNESAFLHLDLAELPNPDGTTSSALQNLLRNDRPNVLIQDDTAVDFVRLTVLRCSH